MTTCLGANCFAAHHASAVGQPFGIGTFGMAAAAAQVTPNLAAGTVHLQAMAAYKSQACDTTGSDRPLVK